MFKKKRMLAIKVTVNGLLSDELYFCYTDFCAFLYTIS